MEIVPKKICEWEGLFQEHFTRMNIEGIDLDAVCCRLYKIK